MESYINDANSSLQNHKKNLLEGKPLTENYIEAKLIAIKDYLIAFRTRLFHNYFQPDRETEIQIIDNLNGMSFIIHSFPLTQVLQPSSYDPKLKYLKKILVFAHKIFNDRNISCSVRDPARKLAIVAFQLRNICLKYMDETGAIELKTYKITIH